MVTDYGIVPKLEHLHVYHWIEGSDRAYSWHCKVCGKPKPYKIGKAV